MDLKYYKPFFLPSNGMLYDKIIHIAEPDVSFVIRINDVFLSLNESDFIFSIIKNFTSFQNPEKLLYRDAYFIWMYFYSLVSKEDHMSLDSSCEHCGEKSSVKVSLDDFKFKVLKDDIEKTITIDDWRIKYTKRTLGHNIETAAQISNFGNYEDNSIKAISLFIKPQITKMEKNGKDIHLKYVDDMILDIGILNLKAIFEKLRIENWGLPDYFEYLCPNCKEDTKAFLCDPLRSSVYSQDFQKKKSEMIENVLTISSTKIISFSEMLGIPISLWDEVVDSIDKIQRQKSGKKNYLDVIAEEMGG